MFEKAAVKVFGDLNKPHRRTSGRYQRTLQYGIDIVPIDADTPYLFALSDDEQISLIEELLVQEIDGLICQGRPESLSSRLLEVGIPGIDSTESDFQHPLFVSPHGLYDIVKDSGEFIAQRLAGRGQEQSALHPEHLSADIPRVSLDE
jgi:hypothetical protein